MSICSALLRFLGDWLLQILRGDAQLAVRAVAVITIVVLQFYFIGKLPIILRGLFGTAGEEDTQSANFPIVLLLPALLLVPMLVYSCRLSMGTIAKVNQNARKRADERARVEAAGALGIHDLPRGAAARAAGKREKSGKKGRRKC